MESVPDTQYKALLSLLIKYARTDAGTFIGRYPTFFIDKLAVVTEALGVLLYYSKVPQPKVQRERKLSLLLDWT